jgi:preprotein translocase subunit SecB
MSIEAPQPSGEAAAGAGITLSMQAVYLKDCSFEAPQGPRIAGEWSPQIGLDINTAVSNITGDLHEVLLTVTVSAKQGEQTMFLAEVKQAGAFVMQGLAEPELQRRDRAGIR